MPPHLRERPPSQLAREGLLANLAEDPLVAHVDAGDLPPQRVPRDELTVLFDLRKFRHKRMLLFAA